MKLPLSSAVFKVDVSFFRSGHTIGAKRIWNDKLPLPNKAVFDQEKRCVVMYDIREGGPRYDEIHVPVENVVQFIVDYSKIDRTKKKQVAKPRPTSSE